MRIDKYLWCIRLYKTRSMATDACRKGHIRWNDSIVKASKEVFVGERLVIRKDQINYQIEILDLPKSRLGAKLVDLYRRDHTPKEQFESRELLKLSQDYYRKKGSGRPTKKDRRDLEDYTDLDTDEEDDF